MQLMATRGLEYETTPGLDWIRGDVKAMRPDDLSLKIPHMGWNTLHPQRDHAILDGIDTGPDGLHAYFVHSYALQRRDMTDVVAVSAYGGPLTAIVAKRQHGRHAIPSREEPGARARAHRQLPAVAAVILFPAIDLKDGRCVRLIQGDMDQATVFNDDPAAQAASFRGPRLRVAARRRSRRRLRGQAHERRGGRIILGADRDPSAARRRHPGHAHRRGLARARASRRVIIGTAAVRDPDFVREAARLHPGRIAVGIDAKDGLVAVEGWAQTSTLTAEELGRRFEDAGVAAIIYTDIARDGILKGLNIPMTLALARAVSIPVIASGGLASMADIERLTAPDCAVLAGAISGPGPL